LTEIMTERPGGPRRRPFTDESIKTLKVLKARKKRFAYPDPWCLGHYIRVMPSGVRSFVCVARDPYGKQIWHTIGRCDEVAIEDARVQAKTMIARIKVGQPPVEPHQAEPQTLHAVAADWVQRHVIKTGLRTKDAIERRLRLHLLPALGERVFTEIKRSDITTLLDRVEDKHGARTADMVLAVLRSMANWHAKRVDDYRPPFVKGMRRSNAGPRDRTLSDEELRIIWNNAESEGAGKFGALVRLALLTGQRREKIISMRWQDVDNAGVWHIQRDKGEKPNGGSLLLPQAALDIIHAQPRHFSNPFVFPAYRGYGHMTGVAMQKVVFDKKLPPLPNWTVHDLRRTARSLMARAKVDRVTAERVLGHTLSQIERTYDVHDYRDEKGAALAALADHIKIILAGPAKVVSIDDARAHRS
jgi:integrase